ncbi:hypothetical protein C8F04DRAFT_1109799 [Mycena alexandri]|uniref:Uncharacterized protein n=1 Tax=Mycena alexandri TaxID=1745969 RepID=A0AAD6STN6_9AGAR|nr:hypothetical protein C8F04DRAFT_1109799 [Mycena alexandri]
MFRTRSQLPPGSSAARPIIVNDYALCTDSTSDYDLLVRGSLAAGHETVWINPNPREIPPTSVSSTSFKFTPKPPENSTKRSLPRLKEWNADVDFGDEVFNLNDLEEFQSTNLNFLFLGNTAKRSYSEVSLGEPPTKRRKLDVASLRNAIPQPHVFPSNSTQKQSSFTPYSRTKPIPIPPHALPLPEPLPYTRRSWVIPVRGTLPWWHATSAVVLLDPNALPEPPDPNTHEEIVWTTGALASFWSFLRLIRDKNTGGSLGLSFNVAHHVSSSNNSQPSYTELSGMGAQPQPFYTQDTGGASSVVSSVRQLAATPLTFLDHIKVYHDAVNSMQVRNLLDAWAFEAGGDKIRLIKTSRLVLLDERSKGIIVL